MKKLKYSLLSLCALVLLRPEMGLSEEGKLPHVVSTIAPLHAIVERVIGKKGTASLLVPANVSPHSYALKPSDRKLLDEADLLVLIHPQFEHFLKDVSVKNSLPMTMQKGMTGVKLEDAHTHNGQEVEWDLHVWLDIPNMEKLLWAVAEVLGQIAPRYKAYYRSNASIHVLAMGQSFFTMQQFLTLAKDKPFVTFHPSLEYIISRFELSHLGSLVHDPSESLSAKRLKALQKEMKEKNVKCIFAGKHDPDRPLKTLAKATDAKIVKLDLLGDGSDYPEMMRDITLDITACLAEIERSVLEDKKEAAAGETTDSQQDE